MPEEYGYPDDTVYDESGTEVSPQDDDYQYYKYLQEEVYGNPLSDDYCKYDHD